MARKRSHCIYNLVGHYVWRPMIFRAPDYFMPWRDLRQHIFNAVKRQGYLVKDVPFIEGLSGYPEGEKGDDPIFRQRLDLEFEKPTYSSVPAFVLFDWSEKQQCFVLRRKNKEGT